MMTLTDSLNDVQRQAVTHTEGPLLVLAGAGSGKTRVLTHKIAHLVRARDVPAREVLAFTFTNKAAGEMRERTERLLGGSLGGVWIGTFHATAIRLLHRWPDAAGVPRGFTIFDRDDSLRVIKRLIKSHHLSDQEFRPRTVLERIGSAKSALVSSRAFLDGAASRYEELLGELYVAYEKDLARQAALDFDDILLRSLRLFADETVANTLSSRFRYVLVDEYQDTNRIQFELTRKLAGRRNLTAVGDDDQSIYGWRGADIRNILDFESTYSDAVVLRLEQNYRSTQRILDAANSVVANNTGRKEKSLWTENAAGDPLRLTLAPDEEREAEDVIRTVLDLRAGDGLALGQTAVLYRTNAQSRPFEEVCLRHRVPYRIVGGVQFFQRKEIKDILAYLRAALNPHDEISFERAVQIPKRGVGGVSLARFFEAARGSDHDLITAAHHAGEVKGIPKRAAIELAHLGRVLHAIANDASPVDEILEGLVRDSGLGDELATGPDGEARRENVDELIAGARHWAVRAEDPGLPAYLEEMSLRTDLDAWEAGEDVLTLMTVHNAKGLEFDAVFIAGLEEGLFPHASSLDDLDAIEEERRLCYVAITRARHRCFLSASLDRRRMNRIEAPRPSRFLDEIPEALVARRDPWGLGLSSGRYQSSSRVRRVGADPASRSAGGFEDLVIDLDADRVTPELLGRVVWHKKFGRGVVLHQEGRGDDAKCDVRFAGQMNRKIVARFLTVEDEDDGFI